ncbi:MAG: NAD-dependent epimerase/dehydratase family protein [Bacteroidota bacterium]
MMKILVTGGSGLIGKYAVEELSGSHTVDVLDLKNPHAGYAMFHRADIASLASLTAVIRGYDAVVHLAGIPNPLNDPADKVFRVNTLGTFNVLEACALNGIMKLVFISSESTLGFAFSRTRMWPEYVPVDELHPLRPQDPYGLSKVAGELLCAGYTRTYGMQTVCLRPPWVWVPEEKEIQVYRGLVKDYPKWPKNLWAYVHVRDLAQAIRLAVEWEAPASHEVMFVCADENWTGRESRALMKEFYPETDTIHTSLTTKGSLISNEKAREILKFSARHSVKDLLG